MTHQPHAHTACHPTDQSTLEEDEEMLAIKCSWTLLDRTSSSHFPFLYSDRIVEFRKTISTEQMFSCMPFRDYSPCLLAPKGVADAKAVWAKALLHAT